MENLLTLHQIPGPEIHKVGIEHGTCSQGAVGRGHFIWAGLSLNRKKDVPSDSKDGGRHVCFR